MTTHKVLLMAENSENQSVHEESQEGMPGSLRGALWMVLAALSFAALTSAIREMSSSMHPFELTFFRNLFGLMFMLPWFWRAGIGALKTDRLKLHGFRSMIGLAAMLFWFSAVAMMPVAEAMALSFTAPLFATIGAAVFLGETVRARRWVATLIGFVGTLVIVRPDGIDIGMASTLALAASAFMSMAALTVKSLSRTDTPNTIVLFMGLLMTPMSLVPALFFWTTPAPTDYIWFVAIGLFATVGQVSMARAFASADISAVLPFDFSRLIFAAVLGYVFFAETPDVWTWVGAGMIFLATLYTAHRESRAARLFRPVQANLVPTFPEQGKTPVKSTAKD
ncbi:MAG: DMT family transporter [Rhodospirillales bacterium]|nr:DMT family transporter [Rhodospirillales bacterium]